MILGGGVVGMNAAFIAIGMEADVFVYDISIDRLRELDIALNGRCSTVYSSTLAIEEMLPRADLVIGAVLVHGARAPRADPPRAARADEAAAPCWSTSRSTRAAASRPRARPPTATRPTRSTSITHYCVTNMPGAVPITSTYALTNATLPYVLALADHGVEGAIARDPGLAARRQRRRGAITNAGRRRQPSASQFTPVDEVLGSSRRRGAQQ